MKQIFSPKSLLVFLAAVLITAAALYYQSYYGPTKPKRVTLWLSDAQEYQFKLPRSHGDSSDCLLELLIPDTTISGELYFRRFPTNDDWQQTTLNRTGEKLSANLPHQPPAGKLEYYFLLKQEGKVIRMPVGEQVTIRFRGNVPAGVIIPHALLMFIAMFLSNLTLLLATFGFRSYRLAGIITTVCLLIGGLVFGPLVQHHAFGEYWTGFPFGFDLTDNKTLIAFVFWIVAVMGNLRKDRRYLTILAALVMLLIFTIPHSSRGSELDPESGEIKTGMVVPAPGHAVSHLNTEV
ncbi:MAG: hypothetical protein JXA72_06510 [Bacteroidales bacterium]|nr:hypothetical protein [Bacteroidales bacterium]